MINRQSLLKLFLISCFFVSLIIVSKESSAAPYYEGKRITIVVGVGPGGGYDRMARMLQKHLPRFIPGKPVIVVENMPGAAGIIAANYVYNKSKPDGLTLAEPQRGMPLAQLLNVDGVKYDVKKYSWVGSTSVESTVLCMRTDLPYKTFADLQKSKKQLMIGGTGLGESSTHFMTLMKEFLGLNIKMIFYPSSADAMLAIERKELDGRAGSFSAHKPFIERGMVRALVRGRASEPDDENLPVDEDLTTDKKAKTMMAMRSTVELIGRPFVAAPKTPPEIMKILRDAFAKVVKDEEFRKEAKKNMMEVQYTTADECLKILNHLFDQPEATVKEFSKYISF